MGKLYALYWIMLLLAAWLAAVTDCPSLFRLPDDPNVLWLSLTLAGLFAGGIVLAGVFLERLPWYRDMAVLLKRMLTARELLGDEPLTKKAFVIAVYSSIGEEAFFRGFVQPWLIALLGGWLDDPGGTVPVVLGVILASLVFGLMHFPVVKELRPWTVFAILAGGVFGALAAWSGSLLAPTLAHFLINWLNLRRLDQLPDPQPSPPPQG